MMYDFYSKDNNLLMQIKSDADLKRMITEFRGAYVGDGLGYKNPKGAYSTDGLCYDDNGAWVTVKKDGKSILPSEHWNAAETRFLVDYRRMLGNILYCLYVGKLVQGTIETLTINGNTYCDIQNVKFVTENDKRIIFEAKSNNKSVMMCIPIALDSVRTYLNSDSSNLLYVLKDESCNLKLYEKYFVYDEENSNKKTYELDLLFGINGEKRGIYYYFKNELVPAYEIKDEGSSYKLCWTDIRNVFFTGTLEKNFVELKKSIQSNDISQYFEAILKAEVLREEDFKEFHKYIKQFIWEKQILKEEIKVTDDLKGEKQDDGTYKFSIKGYDNAYYFVEYTIRGVVGTDYCYEFTQLGKLCVGEFYIELDSEQNNWIIGDSINETEFRVKKEIFSNIKDLCNLEFPEVPEPVRDKIHSDVIYPVESVINNYFIGNDFTKNNIEKFTAVKKKIEEISKSKNEVLKYLNENSVSLITSDVNSIKRILYPTPMVADMEVVTAVYEAKKIYKKNGKMPNFAIMGGPGTGKSTLVKGIAKCLLGEEYSDGKVLYKSTADLKGAYVGHTGARMFDLIKGAAENEQIIFIDEAYNLQKDQFGKEALEICLPLLTGDRKEIESPAVGKNEEVRVYSFEKEHKKIPPIWFAGYEHEMRKMLSENPGLYRRMSKITLSSPTVEGLFNCLKEKCSDKDSLKRHFENNKDSIKNYFDWATSRENVGYFGNYAGVNEFLTTCQIRIGDSDSDVIVKEIINKVIDEKKKEIKKQYKAIIEDTEKIQFEIQNEVDVILDDVKGNEKTVNSLRGIVNMMLNQEEYLKKGINLPKGALLMGPPGTGKTMLARAMAGEIQKKCREKEKKDVKVAFIATIATELDSPKKISALFDEASEYDLSIVFIDEIDAIGKHRNMPGAYPALLIQLMKELDGFETRKNLFVMAATNDPDSLDPALKRPGRFDRTIEVTYPDKEGRKAILKAALLKLSILKDQKNDADALAEELADKTRQYAPANLINLVNEAAILYEECNNSDEEMPHRKNLRSDSSEIDKFKADILEELERLAIGEANSNNKEEEFSIEENKGCSAVAIHEVGHAMVSLLLGLEPFESITILPRGEALGYVKPNNVNQLRTKKDYLNQIRICLGGRVAEELFYGDNISTGAVQDIQQATRYAENMITLFGMNDTIGPMALKTRSNGYLGDNSNYICSDSFRYEVDDAIRKLLSEQMSITRNMLEGQKEKIKQMAEYIFKQESATGEEFKAEYDKEEN